MHLFGMIVWLGGMMFQTAVALPVIRHEGEAASTAMRKVSKRFTGFIWMSVWTLGVTGILMMLLFLYLSFAPWRRFAQAIKADATAEAGKQLGQIRRIVAINLALGVLTVIVGASARPW